MFTQMFMIAFFPNEKMTRHYCTVPVVFSDRLRTDEGPRRERKDPERGRQRDGRGRGRGRPEIIQSHSIFEQGPAEMMAKRRSKG